MERTAQFEELVVHSRVILLSLWCGRSIINLRQPDGSRRQVGAGQFKEFPG
jgi:hypothetical protein